MIKLPLEVQTRISAASTTTFIGAVEELVYNSIDAKATSIAVRIHIKNSFLQVIDNGHGLSKNNLKYIGQQYATTKYDKSDALNIPKHYGYKGQALTSLIKISREVNITSRSKTSEDTWTKSFLEGKEVEIHKTNTRPSIGTTVEIKGFLYNLKIRKKSIDEIKELSKTKRFMEKMCLVHHNISFTVRNNSKNEIIFKALKQRDINQSIFSMCGVEKQDVRELQIEKKKYKVKAFIIDKVNKYKWIYLNNKFVLNGRLNSIVNNEIKKHNHDNQQNKVTLRENLKSECIIERNNDLSYFIFIECPYDKYDFSLTPKQSLLEFRNWEDITKILVKLVQFYYGQLKVKEIKEGKSVTTSKEKEDTRKEVENIIHRVLGSLTKQNKMSQMLNRIKGKSVKRNLMKSSKNRAVKCPDKQLSNNKIINQHISIQGGLNKIVCAKPDVKMHHNEQGDIRRKNKIISEPEKIIKKRKRKQIQNKMVVNKFQGENSLVKRRCNELSANVEQLLSLEKEKQHVIVNRSVQLSNIVKDNKHYTVKKHIEEITVETTEFKNAYCNYIEDKTGSPRKIKDVGEKNPSTIFSTFFPQNDDDGLDSSQFLTYLSHRRVPKWTFESHELNHCNNDHFREKYCYNNRRYFITKESMNNFDISKSTEHLKLPKIHAYNGKPNMKSYYMNYATAIGSSEAITSFTSNPNTIHVVNTYELLGYNAVKLLKYYDQNTGTYTLSQKLIKEPVPRNCESIHMDENMYNELKHACTIVTDMENSAKIFTETESKNKNTYTLSTPIFSWYLQEKHSSYKQSKDKFQKQNDFSSTYRKYIDIGEKETERESLKSNNKLATDIQINDLTLTDNGSENKNTYTLSTPMFSLDPHEQNSSFEEFDAKKQKSNLLFSQYSNVTDRTGKENIKSDRYFNNFSEGIILSEDTTSKSDIILDLSQNNSAIERVNALSTKLNQLNINESDVDSLDLDMIFDKTFKSDEGFTTGAFQFIDRNKLLPKGMSPMCCNKTAINRTAINSGPKCNQENAVFVDQHIFDDFITNIQRDMKIYEPNVQNTKDFTTGWDVTKFKSKVQKDNDSLIFDSLCVKNAVVLGQLDDKFIAAAIEAKCNKTKPAKYLVLFDQHAVHERIRLETNLLDYLIEDQWTSVEIDSIRLKFSNEELLYISNYSFKFKQFGLRWYLISNNELNINGVPKAVLGKHLRSVDKIIVAVKKLILELVDSICFQGRAISLYPKAIMELVFSEACRYAIKFGERLSKETCVKLLRDLALCKVPFQCAHGRPVMAVILEIEEECKVSYSLNLQKILKFKKNI